MAATASPIGVPAGSITDRPGSFNSAQPVKCARTRSNTAANPDSQPRTVDLATPACRAIRAPAIPAAAALGRPPDQLHPGVVLFSGAFALAVKAIMLVFWLIASWTGRDDDGSPWATGVHSC